MRQVVVGKKIKSVDDARDLMQRRLPKFLYQRFEAGSGAGITLRENVKAFEEVTFHPRIARFSPARDLRVHVLGTELSMPVMLGPVGVLGAGRRDGEVAAARAAAAAGIVSVLSTATATPVEDVTAQSDGQVFFQLYYLGGRAGAESMIERAKAAGCKALVVTMDTQARGERDWPLRTRGYAPESLALRHLLRAMPQFAARPKWLLDFARQPLRGGHGLQLPMAGSRADGGAYSLFDMGQVLYRLTPTWEDLEWIRQSWLGPLAIKGVITTEDARRAVDAGADAILVSNHGGNGLDGRPATLRVLPSIAKVVGKQAETWMDGGIRRGSDVVKALALGAHAVLIGRAYLYGLMAAGEPGVARVLEILRSDIDRTLAFLGCEFPGDLDPSFVDVPRTWS